MLNVGNCVSAVRVSDPIYLGQRKYDYAQGLEGRE